MLGADLFPEAAIDLLLLLAGTPDYAEVILPICAGLAGRGFRKRSSLCSGCS